MIKKFENPNKDLYDEQIGNSWRIRMAFGFCDVTRFLEVKEARWFAPYNLKTILLL